MANKSANRKNWGRARITPAYEEKRNAVYRLDKAQLLDRPLYAPPVSVRESALEIVCAGFFRHATGMSSNFLKDLDKDVTIRKEVSTEAPLSAHITLWLKELGQQYQQSPDSNLIFLPFVDRK